MGILRDSLGFRENRTRFLECRAPRKMYLTGIKHNLNVVDVKEPIIGTDGNQHQEANPNQNVDNQCFSKKCN